MGKKLAKSAAIASDVNAIFRWNVLKDGNKSATWTIDLKDNCGMHRDEQIVP